MEIGLHEQLREQAGDRAYRRGEEYLAWNRVRDVISFDDTVAATVDGSRSYRVRLRIAGDRFEFQCECPEGVLGRCCKHSVATGLYWLRLQTADRAGSNLREALDKLPREALTDLLLDEAGANSRLARRLRLRIAQVAGQAPNLDHYIRLLEFASTAPPEEEERFAKILAETGDALRTLLEEGYAAEAARLIESAPVFQKPDANEANRPLIESLLSIHHDACRRLNLTSDAMARKLSDWRIQAPAVRDDELLWRYADLLGSAGQEVYARMIIGDPKRWIDARSRHLHDASDFLALATLCDELGEEELAHEWAVRGKMQFPRDIALLEYLVARYEARNQWEAAVEARYALFCAQPSLDRYHQLLAAAPDLRTRNKYRDRALSPSWEIEGIVPVRISIHLLEGDDEAAWQTAWGAERQRDVSDELWLEIARRRMTRCPDDALQIYQRLIGQHLEHKNEYAYDQVIVLLRRMRQFLTRLKRRHEFFKYVKDLRNDYRARRTLVQRLDRLIARSARKTQP